MTIRRERQRNAQSKMGSARLYIFYGNGKFSRESFLTIPKTFLNIELAKFRMISYFL